MDQCDHPDFNRTILFSDRWMGNQISGRVYPKETVRAWQRMDTFLNLFQMEYQQSYVSLYFCLFTLAIIYAGVRNGIERVSKMMMPVLILLSVIIAIYSVTRPGAIEGVKYFLIPNVKNSHG